MREIVAAPALAEEARAALPALREAALRPAGEVGVGRVLGRRFALFPQPERTDAEWAEWWTTQCEVLAGLPEAALEAGMRAWIRDPKSQFLPLPGRLRELALTTNNPAAVAYHRARLATRQTPTREGDLILTPPRLRGLPEPSAADKAAVRRAAADFAAQVEARRARPVPPSARVPATVDPTGLSAEMRALIARKEESQ